MGFSFSQVEAALAAVHEIADGKRSAFANRLKHLQKLGFPSGVNTGRGRAAAYEGHHVFLLAIALDLLELGLRPERAIRVIGSNLLPIASAGRLSLHQLNTTPPDPSSIHLRFDPSGLNDLRYEDSEGDDADATFWYGGQGSLNDYFETLGTLWHRLALINVSSLISHTFAAFSEVDDALAAAFESQLTEWLASHPEDEDDSDPQA